MMPPLAERIPFEVRLLEVRRRLARLQATIAEQCGPEHRYVQYVDWKLPWCDACGYTDAGVHRSELGANPYRDDLDDDVDDEED